ncbi:MAG TPA: SPFH domain-containing protein [bacterium]|nr:SPFH domain-containing protein [bacterium]
MGFAIFIGILVLLIILVIARTVRVVQQGYVGVIKRLGQFLGVRQPGLVFLVPLIDDLQLVDIRETPRTGDKQDVITRDNVTVAWIRASRFGLGLTALRLDLEAAESLGVRTTLFKNLAHIVSAALVGACGGVYATYLQYVHPDTVFSFTQSISLVLIALIGGLGSVWGPVLGAVIFFVVQDYLQTSYPTFHLLVYGLLLLLIILFEPGGMAGLAARLVARGKRASTDSPTAAPAPLDPGRAPAPRAETEPSSTERIT